MAYPDNFSARWHDHAMTQMGFGSNSEPQMRSLRKELADIERRTDAVQNELNRLDDRWSEVNAEIVALETAN